MDRRTRRVLEQYRLAEDSARHAYVAKAYWALRPISGRSGDANMISGNDTHLN